MRIVYVTASFPFGPGEAFIMPELAELQAQGHELLLVPLRPRGELIHEDASHFVSCTQRAPLLSLEMLREFGAQLSKNTAAMREIGRWCGSRPGKNTLKNFAAWPKAAWLARVAREWHADHIHAFWASTVATLAMAAAELSGIPWSFTAHRFDIVENNLLLRKAERARFVRFISRNSLRMSGLEESTVERRATVLHLGIPSQAAAAATAAGAPIVALCAAAMLPVKGHSTLLRAMQELKRSGVGMELWLAGDGHLRPALQREGRERNLQDRIKFLGEVSHSTLLDLYARGVVSLVVLASTDLGGGVHEAIPVSLMEAMSFAIPAIGTETGGIPELLGGGAGLLVPAQNPSALAAALRLLAENANLRELLGKAGQRRVRTSFAAPAIASELASLFAGGLTAVAAR